MCACYLQGGHFPLGLVKHRRRLLLLGLAVRRTRPRRLSRLAGGQSRTPGVSCAFMSWEGGEKAAVSCRWVFLLLLLFCCVCVFFLGGGGEGGAPCASSPRAAAPSATEDLHCSDPHGYIRKGVSVRADVRAPSEQKGRGISQSGLRGREKKRAKYVRRSLEGEHREGRSSGRREKDRLAARAADWLASRAAFSRSISVRNAAFKQAQPETSALPAEGIDDGGGGKRVAQELRAVAAFSSARARCFVARRCSTRCPAATFAACLV